jgi:hypothetical protein
MNATKSPLTTPALIIAGALLVAAALGFVGCSSGGHDHSGHSHGTASAEPYPLKTCIVSSEEINDKGDMKPHAFVVEGQKVKLCCRSCLKDFNKDKAG